MMYTPRAVGVTRYAPTAFIVLFFLAVACGGGQQQAVQADQEAAARAKAEQDRQAAEEARRKAEEEKKLEEELTIKKLVIPAETKFVPGVDQDAQLKFRDGVIALYQTPPQFKQAEEAFKGAVEKDKGFAEAHFNLGLTYERQGQLDRAEQVYLGFSKAQPDNLDAKGYLAKIHLVRAKKARSLGKDAEFKAEADKAKAICTEVMAKNPENVMANNAMALYFAMSGDNERAEEYVKNVLTVEPADVTALTTRALIFLQKDDLNLAKWTIEQKVLREDPNATEALNDLGIVYMRMGNTPGAVANFKKAIAADVDNLEARLNLAAILLNYLNYEAAQEQYEYVLKAQPDSPEAVVGMGSCSFGKRKFDEAIASYQKAYDLDRRKVELLERIGRIHESYRNDVPKALDVYRQYMRLAGLGPGSDLAMKVDLLEKMWKESQQAPPPPPGEPKGSGGPMGPKQPEQPGPGGEPAPGLAPAPAPAPTPAPTPAPAPAPAGESAAAPAAAGK